MKTSPTWHIVTGEYPPTPGGVSDFTAQVAEGLARLGQAVHVWTAGHDRDAVESGVIVHRAAGRWSRTELDRLGAAIDAFPPPRRLFIQYTPNSWGFKGLNFGFARWLQARRAAGDLVELMLHEPWYRPEPWDRPWRRLLPPAQRWLIREVLKSITKLDLSTNYWSRLLEKHHVTHRSRWLPVPSNVPRLDGPARVQELRERIAPGGEAVVGTFGTYREEYAPALARVLPWLVGQPGRVALLLGRNGREFAARLARANPTFAGRVVAMGGQPANEVSLGLQACDILIQPYRGGVTTRRTTVMAGLEHGRAIVTTRGPQTEPLWDETGAVALVDDGDLEALSRAALGLLDDPAARQALGDRARKAYDSRFALERTLETLLLEDDS